MVQHPYKSKKSWACQPCIKNPTVLGALSGRQKGKLHSYWKAPLLFVQRLFFCFVGVRSIGSLEQQSIRAVRYIEHSAAFAVAAKTTADHEAHPTKHPTRVPERTTKSGPGASQQTLTSGTQIRTSII